MDEIEPVIRADPGKQRIVAERLQGVPTHVRRRQPRTGRQRRHFSRDDTEGRRIAFIRALEQQLHAEADTEQGTSERAHGNIHP